MKSLNDWVIAHRGLWANSNDQNTLSALDFAFESGLGVETDFRDRNGGLVVSHDIVLEDDFLIFNGFVKDKRYAINLKADGLLGLISPYVEEIQVSKSFVFDGSVPEMVRYRNAGIPHALRISEYESEIPWHSPYIWVDSFISDWWMSDRKIPNLLRSHHLVFVSPELHGRDHRAAFEHFVWLRNEFGNAFSVCTDFPIELLELTNA